VHFQGILFEEGGGIMIWEDLRCQARWFAIDICLSARIFLKHERYSPCGMSVLAGECWHMVEPH